MTGYKSDHEKDVHEADGPPVNQNGNRNQSTFDLTMPGAGSARRWRIRVSDALLVVASVLLTYLLFEAAFSLIGLRYVPLRLQQYLSNELRPFAQSSKAGVVPRHPVVLLGDSYAQGAGDWLLETNPNGNGAFHSAHVINHLTDRDVVTLGHSGAGSVQGMVALPRRAYGQTVNAWYLRLPKPDLVVEYYYEGNDFKNNLAFVRRHSSVERLATLKPADAAKEIDEAIAKYASEFSGSKESFNHFPFLSFMVHVAVGNVFGSVLEDEIERTDRNPPTIVDIAGKAQEFPGRLQAPALELSDVEWKISVLVFERSLANLRTFFPNTPILVVYLPSPLSSYRLVSNEITIQDGEKRLYPMERVATYSNRMCQMIRTSTANQNAGFLDLRPAIRAATADDILHGPRDFRHFNRKGYEVLGRAVAERIASPRAAQDCSELTSGLPGVARP